MTALPESARAVLEGPGLAPVYPGPDLKFPPTDDPPPGYITVARIGGVGPWAS